MSPALSVLLCTRNRGEKIRHAIDSILANSFTDYELVIVDQSTDDKTSNVMGTYTDPRIRYIRTDTVGLARSRNIAIRESKAEIVVFTDDDCICDKDWLSSIVAAYESDPSLMGVYGRVLPYGTGGHGMFCHCLIGSMERRAVDKPVIPYNVLGHGNNMSFKKEVFRKVGLYIESLGAGTWMKGGEDTELIYRALGRRMKFGYSPTPLVYHDNWMPVAKAAELECGYILAAVAIFTKFALRMNGVALSHIVHRGAEIIHRIGYHLIRRNRDQGLTLSLKRLGWFVVGLVMGLKYSLVPIQQFSQRNQEEGDKSMPKPLTLDNIQRIKERYIHPYEKHKQIINDMLLFQDQKLNITAHYRKVKGFDTPYDINKEEYDIENNICGAWEYAFIIMNLPLQQGLTILEAASSASILPAYLSELGYSVTSVDLDISYQEKIRKESKIDYRIIKADLKQIPLPDNSVDVIISNSALEHIPDDVAMWKEFTRVLKRGGKMIHTFPVARPGYRKAWVQEPVDFFANPTELHNRTHRIVDKKIAESRYFIPNKLGVEIWEEHFYLREIQAYCVVVKE